MRSEPVQLMAFLLCSRCASAVLKGCHGVFGIAQPTFVLCCRMKHAITMSAKVAVAGVQVTFLENRRCPFHWTTGNSFCFSHESLDATVVQQTYGITTFEQERRQ